MKEQVCTHCKKSKPLTEFYRNRTLATGYFTTCKPCERISQKSRNFKMQFGITLDEFNTLSKKQKELCAICKGKKKLFIDCSKEKEIRGLLCKACLRGVQSIEYFSNLGYSEKDMIALVEAKKRGELIPFNQE